MENSMPESRLPVRKHSLIVMESRYSTKMEMLKHMMSTESSVMQRHLIQARRSVMKTWKWGFTVIIHLRTVKLVGLPMQPMLRDRTLQMLYKKLRKTDLISAIRHILKKMVWIVISRMPSMFLITESRLEQSPEASLLLLLI